MDSNVVMTDDLRKSYGKKEALAGLTVNIAKQSVTGLIGRNGSGKTTLLKIIAGVLNTTSGHAKVFGELPMDNLSVLNRLVYACHNTPYEKSLKLDTILYSYKTMFKNFDSAFAGRLMKYFELSGKMKYKSLSQGMCSIFNFLCALSCRTELTMLDEPVLGMDVTVRKAVYDILLRDFAEFPRTFIISSHLLSEIEGLLSDILLIEEGKAVLHSSIDEVRQSAYRIDGSQADISNFIEGKKTLAVSKSDLSSFAVVYEPYTADAEKSAKSRGLTVSNVRAEDLCVYLTRQNKEEELECLW